MGELFQCVNTTARERVLEYRLAHPNFIPPSERPKKWCNTHHKKDWCWYISTKPHNQESTPELSGLPPVVKEQETEAKGEKQPLNLTRE